MSIRTPVVIIVSLLKSCGDDLYRSFNPCRPPPPPLDVTAAGQITALMLYTASGVQAAVQG